MNRIHDHDVVLPEAVNVDTSRVVSVTDITNLRNITQTTHPAFFPDVANDD